MKNFTVVVEQGEDDYLIGTVLEIRGCHSQGKNLQKLMENIKEAIELCIEVETDTDPYIKEIVGIQKVAI